MQHLTSNVPELVTSGDIPGDIRGDISVFSVFSVFPVLEYPEVATDRP